MANLTDLGKIANDFGFQSRCMQAGVKAAIDIMAEGAVANHAERIAYAQVILHSKDPLIEIARAVLENSTIASGADITVNPDKSDYAISDGDIQFTVNSVFNALAGISN